MKRQQSRVAKANAREKEPPMPVRAGRGKRTEFTDKTAERAVAILKARRRP